MNLLALDTSTDHLSLAIARQNERFEFHQPVGQQHAERLLPELRLLLEQASMSLNELDAIVYGQGPGSFTGLRISAGIAQGLAFAHELPLISIPTLDSVAAQSPQTAQLLVCLDARMQQMYTASYDTRSGVHRLTDITLVDPASLRLETSGWTAVGDGFAVYADQLPPQLGNLLNNTIPTLRPRAAAYLDLALSGTYPQTDAAHAELLYVRNKVALTAQEQKARHA